MGEQREPPSAAALPNPDEATRTSRRPDPAARALLHMAIAGVASELEDELRPTLADAGCEVHALAGMPALLELVRGRALDLVLVDADALGVDPRAVTRDIKAAAPQTIVTLIVDGSSSGPVVAAMRAGAYDLFLKPVDAGELRARIRQAIQNKRLGQGITRRSRQVEETARQRSREVREVTQHLENLVETAGDAIITADLENRVTAWNRSAQETLGHAKDEILGADLLALAGGQRERDQLAALLDDARHGKTTSNAETVWVRQDGKEVIISLTVSAITDSARRAVGILIVARDITERKKLQEELFHAEKLASIGQLAAGVAHQINNPLGAISGRAQMLARLKAPADHKFLQEQIGKIQRDCARISKTVNDLLGFARKTETDKQHTDVNAVLDETLEMVKHATMTHKVRIERRAGADLPLVVASAHHLQQLFANLITNAFDAMDPGGTLTITSVLRPATEEGAAVVEVAFADTGCGIPEEELAQIFEPFFTTKPPGEGTGLGLAVAKRIVDFHGGHIAVQSRAGVGTTFTVQLPAE